MVHDKIFTRNTFLAKERNMYLVVLNEKVCNRVFKIQRILILFFFLRL